MEVGIVCSLHTKLSNKLTNTPLQFSSMGFMQRGGFRQVGDGLQNKYQKWTIGCKSSRATAMQLAPEVGIFNSSGGEVLMAVNYGITSEIYCLREKSLDNCIISYM